MKNLQTFVVFCFLSLFFALACETDSGSSVFTDADRASESDSFSDATSSEGGSEGSGNGQFEAGLVTAAEWNDLENWDFWNRLLNEKEYSEFPTYWGYYTNNRLAVRVLQNETPVENALITMLQEGTKVWEARSDNAGRAELWAGLFERIPSNAIPDLVIEVDGVRVTHDWQWGGEVINEININNSTPVANRVEIAFMVDATGSMGDELEFLKKDLVSVIERAEQENANTSFFTGTVFYRDVEDDYLVRHSGFSSEVETTAAFIQEQSADGGGDYPEAVHTALNATLSELQWSNNARARIAFLVLDAPPHYEPHIVSAIQNSVKEAAAMGVKLIPITASGIDKPTEFLMRFIAMSTNGTYVFITNDSGIGNDHLEASVGEYEVEKLNDLLVRLISKYSS